MPNAANVSTGKPKVAGAVFCAPKGTSLPTDAATALAAAFKELGYASEDGVTNSNSVESDSQKAWGGDQVLTMQTSKTDKFKVKLIECKNIETLKAVYGSTKVTGSALSSGITVAVGNSEPEHCAWVFDMIMNGGTMKRIVIPDAVISELGDIVYKDDEATGYEVTLSAMADSSGNTHYEYMKDPTTGTGSPT